MSNKRLNIGIIGGARPNFMKVAPLHRALKKHGMRHFIVNTNQHFDANMSRDFFHEFGFTPKYHLNPSRVSVIKQFSDILIEIEEVFEKEKPNLVVVVGDVNSTLAGAIAAKKMNISLAHVEAGLRSFNGAMPEEKNRILTDHISDLLFATEESGLSNLKKEGLRKNVYFVGNIMIDAVKAFAKKIKKTHEEFYFCTLHRAENIDNKKVFSEILDALEVIAKDKKIYLPLHPRTEKMAERFKLEKRIRRIFHVLPPLTYQESLFYQKNAMLVLTDSGGIQEETSFFGTPCLTLRTETERPITVARGTNTIAGVTKKSILSAYRKKTLQKGEGVIPLWDGKAAERIVKIIKDSCR